MIFDGYLTLSPSGVLVSLCEEELKQTAHLLSSGFRFGLLTFRLSKPGKYAVLVKSMMNM